MTEQDSNPFVEKPGIRDTALKVAEHGNRWFLSLARNLGGIARWAQTEARMVASSAKDAAVTTGRITKKLVSRTKKQETCDEAAPGNASTELLEKIGTLAAGCPLIDPAQLKSSKGLTDLVELLPCMRSRCAAAEGERISRVEDSVATTAAPPPNASQ